MEFRNLTQFSAATRVRRQRRKLGKLFQLTDDESRLLERWQGADALNAVRLLIRQLFSPELIPIVVRRPMAMRQGMTLVDVLLTEGPDALITLVDAEFDFGFH